MLSHSKKWKMELLGSQANWKLLLLFFTVLKKELIIYLYTSFMHFISSSCGIFMRHNDALGTFRQLIMNSKPWNSVTKTDTDCNVDISFNTGHTWKLADTLQVAFKDNNITHKIFNEMKLLGVLSYKQFWQTNKKCSLGTSNFSQAAQNITFTFLFWCWSDYPLHCSIYIT